MPGQTSRRRFLQGAAAAGGAVLAGCAGPPPEPPAPGAPRLNERARGWLRFLWDKATTPDDWGYSENPERPWGMRLPPRGAIDFTDDGVGPHPWWDQYTTPPMLSFPRFDLADSSYAVLLMADQTPAWREVYTRIMDELATRHTAYWAAIDWNTFIGPSPDRGAYPPAMTAAWPERLRGRYDFPGWTANGVAPWGLQPDPIGADGNLFFRGWLNLVLGIYKYVSGDDKWERPWQVAGYENERFEWTQPRVVEHLRRQYLERPEGPHCENTKIWPFCNAAAGLGMFLSDRLGASRAHGAFENWVEFMKDNYMSVDARGAIEWMTLYYDPLEDFKVNTPGAGGAGAGVAFYLLPQSPELATAIYEANAVAQGWRDPARDIAPSALGLVMAQALGDHAAAERLRAAAERAFEPRWFGENMDRFGWWFQLGEPWPRGQRSAQMMIAEIEQGNWMDAFQLRHLDKHDAPTVEGVDYPALGIDQAWNDRETGMLHVGTYAADESRRGRETSWRVTGLPDAAAAVVLADGAPMSVEVLDAATIRIRSDIDRRRFDIHTGWRGERRAAAAAAARGEGDAARPARRRTAAENARAAESVLLSGAAGCPCCRGAA